MGGRDSDDFYACDIISDILSNGQSSRLYVNLIKNQRLFSGIDAYVSGDRDPGLFIFVVNYPKVSTSVRQKRQ